MQDIRIVGVQRLEALGAELRVQGTGKARSRMRRSLAKSAKPVIQAVRDRAESELPRSGGLNTRSASAKLRVSTRLVGRNVGVSVRGPRRGVGSDLGRVNQGEVRHPFYGDRSRWYVTRVRPGFADRALADTQPDVVAGLVGVMEQTQAEIVLASE